MKNKIGLQEATLQALAQQANDLIDEQDEVEGIMDGVLVITDPEVSTDDYEEIIEKAQDLVEDTPQGEIPFDDEYIGSFVQTCPICGSTFTEDKLLESGDTCPICLQQPENFITKGKIEGEEEIDAINEENQEEEEEEDFIEPEEEIKPEEDVE